MYINLIFYLSWGGVQIDAPKIYFGMIRLGFRTSDLYPNNGITWRNNGGTVIFKGECIIGNDSYIICGKKGRIEFGDNFFATGNIRIVSEIGITIGNNVLIGWGSILLDTDFHPLYDMITNEYKKSHGAISIADNNWIAAQCFILHSVHTGENDVFAARSIINRHICFESNCLYGGQPIKLLCQNVRLDAKHRSINYNE